jgi:hypothetical protein
MRRLAAVSAASIQNAMGEDGATASPTAGQAQEGAAKTAPKKVAKPPYVKPFAGAVKVLPPTGRSIYHSARPDFCPVENCVTSKRVRSFETLAGKDLAWASLADNWFDGIWFPVREVKAVWKAGAIPFVRALPRLNYKYGCGGPYTLERILAGRYDKQLRRYARAAAATGIPIMFDWAAEPNGWWFPWSGICAGGETTGGYGDKNTADGPERYIAVWRKLHAMFAAEGADNVTWVYHPNGGSSPVAWWNNQRTYYPGDAYVDWIGTSSYGVQQPKTPYWWSLDSTFSVHYREMARISKTKPLALIEFGVVEDPPNSKANWIRDGFAILNRERYPRLAAVGWWQANWRNQNGKWSLVRIDSSPASLSAYRRAVSAPRFTGESRLSAER